MGFRKAERKGAKGRVAIFGPSGSGKTFSALRIARGLVGEKGRIGLIDTEHGSASLYAGVFDFDVLDLSESPGPARMCAALDEAEDAGYDCVVIDSLSHAWQELLDEVDRLTKTKHKGNSWSAWRDGTPMQRELVRKILSLRTHIICTMRSKTEWVQVESDKGKRAPQRVGLAPEQGKGIEYEFTVLLELSADQWCEVIKDRTGHLQDEHGQNKRFRRPDEKFGDWLRRYFAEEITHKEKKE